MNASATDPSIVDAWLEPLADSPCGNDPEYDNDFAVDLANAAAGKPATQFDPAGEPPNWRLARTLAETLFERTRDLRVAIYWARAMLQVEGAPSLVQSMRLIHGLLARHWDDLHPKPDDGDAYARVNALNDMCSATGLLGELRQALMINNRAVGELRGRHIEMAMGTLEARSGEMPMSRGQVEQMLATAVEADPGLAAFPAAVVSELEQLNALMRERVGYGSAPNLDPLIAVFTGLASMMPGAASGEEAAPAGEEAAGDAGEAAAAGTAPRKRGAGLSGGIESREDALRAIDMVCSYLERAEPTNPAQLLLRRARKLVDKNFLELVREFAPASVEEVARILGVSPDGDSGSSY
jgi:type VI secretion system protein ImpA